ncbi:MAG: hypothetical protein HY820_45535 [Acidobacteria bacterium]|nr:hypothetical protein [Acidobacteriota bacterium]
MPKLKRDMVIDHGLQRALDLAVVKQAIRDLWLRTDGYRMRRKEQRECNDLMLYAAAWFFVAPESPDAFSFRQICDRSRIDPVKAAIAVFAGLPDERRREIWQALRNYRKRLLPLSWQACGPAKVPDRHPKGRRYLSHPPQKTARHERIAKAA